MCGEQEVNGLIAGDDADREIHRAELVGDAVRAGAHLAAGGTVEPLEWRPGTKTVHHFAALIGRTEHDGAAKAGNGVFAEVLAQQNATHGVGNEMDATFVGALR